MRKWGKHGNEDGWAVRKGMKRIFQHSNAFLILGTKQTLLDSHFFLIIISTWLPCEQHFNQFYFVQIATFNSKSRYWFNSDNISSKIPRHIPSSAVIVVGCLSMIKYCNNILSHACSCPFTISYSIFSYYVMYARLLCLNGRHNSHYHDSFHFMDVIRNQQLNV